MNMIINVLCPTYPEKEQKQGVDNEENFDKEDGTHVVPQSTRS